MTAQPLSVNRTRPVTPLPSQYGFRIVSLVNFCSLVALPDKHISVVLLSSCFTLSLMLFTIPPDLFADPTSPEYPARL